MKAVKVMAPGGLDHLSVVDIPDPGAPGPGHIRVRVRASSLNFHDYGVARHAPTDPNGRILLADAAGEIEAVGEHVTEFKPGDHVVAGFFPQWQDGPPEVDNFRGVPGDGLDGYAREVVVTPANWFTRAPRGYSHMESATITTAGLTAWRALFVDGGLTPGRTILTLGTGGVSIFALQIGKAMGCRVICTSSSDDKLKRLTELGADHVINYKTTPEWGQAVRDLTGGRGVDHVVEVGGQGTLPQSVAAVATGGHIALIGVLTGAAGEFPTVRFMAKQARLQGLIVGSRRHQNDFVRALDGGWIRPVIDSVFPLAKLTDAFRLEAAHGHFGKIGIEI